MTHSPFPWTRDAMGLLVDANGVPVWFRWLEQTSWSTAPSGLSVDANTRLIEAIPAMIVAGNAMADFMETAGATGGDYETLAAAWRTVIDKALKP